MSHAYRLTLRPASIGTFPTEDAQRNKLDFEITESHWPPVRTEDGRWHHATVEYAAPLPFDQIWRMDMRPVDPVERAHYLFWETAFQDKLGQTAEQLEAEWLAEKPTLLVQLRDFRHDVLAAAALVLLEAENGTE